MLEQKGSFHIENPSMSMWKARGVSALARCAVRSGTSLWLHPQPGCALRRLATRVTVLTEEEHFEQQVNKEELSVVYFTAAWCGPCKMISPIFEEIAEQHPAATFLKVDVDDQPDVAAAAEIRAMPTFQFWKSGALLDQIVGADPQKLADCTKKHVG